MRPQTGLFRLSLVAALVAVSAVTAAAHAEDSPEALGRLDMHPFAITMFSTDATNVAPHLPAGFRPIEVGGKTSLFLNVGIFENTSFLFANGSTLSDPVRYSYAEFFVPVHGPEGSDDPGLFGLWRLASEPVFPVFLQRLGMACGTGGPPRTSACHTPELTVEEERTASGTTLDADVAWEHSPYTLAASFAPTSLPTPTLPVPAWLLGRRLVREDVIFGTYPRTITAGIGTATVVADPDSPLSEMLGNPPGGKATGLAILLRGVARGVFNVR